jgi:hypothetical protein
VHGTGHKLLIGNNLTNFVFGGTGNTEALQAFDKTAAHRLSNLLPTLKSDPGINHRL